MDPTVEWLYGLALITMAVVQFFLMANRETGMAIPTIIALWALWLVAYYLGVLSFAVIVIFTIVQAMNLLACLTGLVIERRRRNDGSD